MRHTNDLYLTVRRQAQKLRSLPKRVMVLGLGPRPVFTHLSVLLSTSSWVLSAMAPRGSLPTESAEAWKQMRQRIRVG